MDDFNENLSPEFYYDLYFKSFHVFKQKFSKVLDKKLKRKNLKILDNPNNFTLCDICDFFVDNNAFHKHLNSNRHSYNLKCKNISLEVFNSSFDSKYYFDKITLINSFILDFDKKNNNSNLSKKNYILKNSDKYLHKIVHCDVCNLDMKISSLHKHNNTKKHLHNLDFITFLNNHKISS
jgi:hypothetical protein